MNNKAIVFLNHNLNDNQISELNNKCITEIIYPSDEIKARFGQVPTDSEINVNLCKEILTEIKNSQAETVIIQGEMGHCFTIISELVDNGIRVFHAVAERKTVEVVKDGVSTKTSVFEHKCFREYKKFPNLVFGK